MKLHININDIQYSNRLVSEKRKKIKCIIR